MAQYIEPEDIPETELLHMGQGDVPTEEELKKLLEEEE